MGADTHEAGCVACWDTGFQDTPDGAVYCWCAEGQSKQAASERRMLDAMSRSRAIEAAPLPKGGHSER